ncbi:hypothetical protein V6N13_088107 [Hibiscus sabdariffa]
MVQTRAACQVVRPPANVISSGLDYWEPPPVEWTKLNTDGACLEALRILKENYRGLHPLVGHLTNLRRRAWRVKIQHGLRSGNKVVHVLATSTSVDTLESLYYTQLPDSVLQVLHEDSLRSL